jgi:hypothetical protein
MDKIYSQHSLRIKKNQLLQEYGKCQENLQKYENIKYNVIQNISSKRGCHDKTPREIIAKIERDYRHKPEKLKKILERFYKYLDYDDKCKETQEKYDDVTLEIILINEKLGNNSYDLYSEDEEINFEEYFNL